MYDVFIGRPAGAVSEFTGKYPFFIGLVAAEQREIVRNAEDVIILAKAVVIISFAFHVGIADSSVPFLRKSFRETDVGTIGITCAVVIEKTLYTVGLHHYIVKLFVPTFHYQFQIV